MPFTTKMKTLTKYFTLENVIFVFIILSIFLYLFFQINVLHTDNPQVAVTTTSMVPTYQGYNLTQEGNSPTQYYDILRGDLLIIENIPATVGDAIVFNPYPTGNSVPVVHRIVAEKNVDGVRYFATKGDHNPTTDAGIYGNHFGWIPENQVIGVVVFVIHHIGWFSLQLQSSFFKILLVLVIIAIVIYSLYDYATKSSSKTEKDSSLATNDTKKVVILKLKRIRIKINHPRIFTFLIIALILTTYFGIGFMNYKTQTNTVTWKRTSNVIDLRPSLSSNTVESFTNLYMYDCVIQINSSGSLNYVYKVIITPVFTNSTYKNPSYVWTIVYDYYGSKDIHAVFLFGIPDNVHNVSLNGTLNFTVYSAGLLAAPPKNTSVPIEVLV